MRKAMSVLALVLAAAPAAAQSPASQPARPAAAPAPASQPALRPAPRLLHAAPAAATARRDLDLRFSLEGPGAPPAARVHYRTAGERDWTSVPVQRATDAWVATIPAVAVTAPALEYYVAAADPPARLFAAADRPQRVQVLPSDADEELEADLAFYGHHRSIADTSFEVVDFGRRAEGADYYLRSETSYRYLMLGFVHHIRVGFGLIRGEAPSLLVGPLDRGIYFGFAELRLRFHPTVHFDLRPILGATKDGFDGGIGTVLHLGRFSGTQVSLGFEYLGSAGHDGWLRLGWRTVPRFPMGFSLELTDLLAADARPDGHSTALRAVYDVSFAPTSWLALTMKVGYEARDYQFGGVAGGFAASFSF
jgi:hypothetical protein